jgi:hypothetical protein
MCLIYIGGYLTAMGPRDGTQPISKGDYTAIVAIFLYATWYCFGWNSASAPFSSFVAARSNLLAPTGPSHLDFRNFQHPIPNHLYDHLFDVAMALHLLDRPNHAHRSRHHYHQDVLPVRRYLLGCRSVLLLLHPRDQEAIVSPLVYMTALPR